MSQPDLPSPFSGGTDTASRDEAEVRNIRIPPQSIEAEQAVLGSVLLHPRAFEDVCDVLEAEDFYRTDHQVIWNTFARLKDAGTDIDVLTVSRELESFGSGARGIDVTYLAELADRTPAASNVSSYAQVVRDRSTRRRLIDAGSKIAEDAFRPEGRSTRDLLGEAEREVFRIADRNAKVQGPMGASTVIKQALARIDRLIASKEGITGLSTGFGDLDEMTSGLQESDLVIVAARPSMGKTSFAMNLVEHAVMQDDPGAVLVFSMEMPAEGLMLRMLSSLGRINQGNIRTGQLGDDDWPRLISTVNLLQGRPLFIDETPALSPQDVAARARRVANEIKNERAARAGEEEVDESPPLSMIVVDYLQLMQVPGNQENRAGEISEISRSLKALAKDMKCPVVALSQLNRALEQRPNKRPVMSDLRESGAIEQDADLILFIYRDEVYNAESPERGTAEIIIGKQRNGPIGTVKLAFLGELTKFESLAPGRYESY